MKNVHFTNKKISRQFFTFIWVLYTIVYMSKNCFTAAMASIVYEGIMTKSQTGLITAVFYLVYAPLQIVGGICADKYDPEKLIVIGLFGGAVANFIIFFNHNYYLVLVVWVLNAVVQFALWPSVFKIVSAQLVSGDRKDSAYYMSFSSTAGILLAYFVAAIVPKWTHNFLVSGVTLLLLAIILSVITKRVEIYTEHDEPIEFAQDTKEEKHDISVVKLFVVSGFFILIIVAFLRTVVGNSIKTLAATMLMETYDVVSPSLGNLINMFIAGLGVVGTIITKVFLYPKRVKSAPYGILLMLTGAFICCVILNFIERLDIAVTVIAMCFMSCCVSSVVLFTSYCTLRFAKFGRSATASGVMNACTSFGVVVNSYGVTKLAEIYDWYTVIRVFTVLLLVAIVLTLAVILCWKKFKKKYFSADSKQTVCNMTN